MLVKRYIFYWILNEWFKVLTELDLRYLTYNPKMLVYNIISRHFKISFIRFKLWFQVNGSLKNVIF
jgi:hypothetical protein